MNAVVLIGTNKEFVFNLAKSLATIFNLKHIDIDQEFETDLILENNNSILDDDLILRNKETALIKKFSQKKNVIISLNDDTFLANKHYENLKDTLKIFVKKKENNKLKQKIQNFIMDLCNYSVSEEYLDINKLVEFIRGKNNG